MADFKVAIEALANGKLEISALSKQLSKLLLDNPKFATRLLEQLDEANEQGKIDNTVYTELKRQINDFRRSHAKETETGVEVSPEATVFDNSKVGDAVGSEDSTEINQCSEDIGSEDSTEIDPRKQTAGDATQVLSEDEKGATSDSSVDFDISSGTSPSLEGGTGPTGTDWEEPQQHTQTGEGRDLDVGDVIKQRFKLLDVLGGGGMGKVFKGIDLLKEEARDKNPCMAIKLLNEDFKSHPEAFISLQRESSRQQKLAHQNIATVYDFDRIGGKGTPVYITMELMEGQPLNTYIKKVVKKQGGLPFDEAFGMIKQLASALEYAHKRRLVHSDFKPGNAFLCNDGMVKTLGFGIARAVKNPITGEAEKTLFDPGKLGALTPAYASLEMLEGEEPDTRDDTYALGCVAYELLTGKHPFNKLPATTARENGLVAPIVKGLNKKSNRGLRRSVAFKREDRSQTVMEFIEEFEGLPTWHKHPATWADGVLLIIGLMMINPMLDRLHDSKIQGIIADMNSGGNSIIVEKLEEIKLLDEDDQGKITMKRVKLSKDTIRQK